MTSKTLLTAALALISSVGIVAQSAPPACPADRPVDDIIGELHRQEAKSKHRGSLLPGGICVFGWCREISKTPPTFPEPAPQAKAPDAADSGSASSSSKTSSSSKSPDDACNDAMESALKAAHDVDVGDYDFSRTSYHGALLRYQSAVEEKPLDPAIHVRLGSVFEKLEQPQQAIGQYNAALKLAGPEKWSRKANAGLARLQNPQQP